MDAMKCCVLFALCLFSLYADTCCIVSPLGVGEHTVAEALEDMKEGLVGGDGMTMELLVGDMVVPQDLYMMNNNYDKRSGSNGRERRAKSYWQRRLQRIRDMRNSRPQVSDA